jgi:hypothetical protein
MGGKQGLKGDWSGFEFYLTQKLGSVSDYSKSILCFQTQLYSTHTTGALTRFTSPPPPHSIIFNYNPIQPTSIYFFIVLQL